MVIWEPAVPGKNSANNMTLIMWKGPAIKLVGLVVIGAWSEYRVNKCSLDALLKGQFYILFDAIVNYGYMITYTNL